MHEAPVTADANTSTATPADEHSGVAEFGETSGPDPFSLDDYFGGERGGPEYGPFLAAFRRVQDALAQANPPTDDMVRLTDELTRIGTELEWWRAPEREWWAGRRRDLPGRGSALASPFIVTSREPERIEGTVRFSAFHVGGNLAVHGGVLGLLFDGTLGELANLHQRSRTPEAPLSRTAYLHINYRNITPIDADLTFEVHVDRVEGRKTFVTGSLRHGTKLLADAEALFLVLRPGQQ